VFRTDVTVDQASVPVQLVLLPPAWNAIIFDRVEWLSLLGLYRPGCLLASADPAQVVCGWTAGPPGGATDSRCASAFGG
jgi:hypothetical protein